MGGSQGGCGEFSERDAAIIGSFDRSGDKGAIGASDVMSGSGSRRHPSISSSEEEAHKHLLALPPLQASRKLEPSEGASKLPSRGQRARSRFSRTGYCRFSSVMWLSRMRPVTPPQPVAYRIDGNRCVGQSTSGARWTLFWTY